MRGLRGRGTAKCALSLALRVIVIVIMVVIVIVIAIRGRCLDWCRLLSAFVDFGVGVAACTESERVSE